MTHNTAATPRSLHSAPRHSTPLAHRRAALGLVLGAVFAATVSAQCPRFGDFLVRGHLQKGLRPSGTLEEVSGVVASRQNPGVLWMHDDSGADAMLIAVRMDGTVVQQFELDGVNPWDWEDIAIGKGPERGRDYLYIADIGDNRAERDFVTMYVVAEPELPATPQSTIRIDKVSRYDFVYPGGRGRNAETLLIDPADGAPYIVTKENTTRLFRYPLPFVGGSTKKTLEEVGRLPSAVQIATGGDLTADGSLIYVRTERTVFGFHRARGQTLADAMRECSVLFQGNQGQAEALAVGPKGRCLITVAEGGGSPILVAEPTTPVTVPAAWGFGEGLASATGTPGLAPWRAPVLDGQGLWLGFFRARPSARALARFSANANANHFAPFLGGRLYILDGITLLTQMRSDGTGVLRVVRLPTAEVQVAAQVHAQLFVEDPTAPDGVAMSAGLTMQFAR